MRRAAPPKRSIGYRHSRRARPSTPIRPTTTAISSTEQVPRWASTARRPSTSAPSSPTPSVCTTCTATSGSGSRTATRTATPARPRTARPSSIQLHAQHPARRGVELLPPAASFCLSLCLRSRCTRGECGLSRRPVDVTRLALGDEPHGLQDCSAARAAPDWPSLPSPLA